MERVTSEEEQEAMESLAEFRSIEAVEATRVLVQPDRVVLAFGNEDGTWAIVPFAELDRVKVRTLLGISTLLLKTKQGRTIIADLMKPADARAAADLIQEGLAGALDV